LLFRQFSIGHKEGVLAGGIVSFCTVCKAFHALLFFPSFVFCLGKKLYLVHEDTANVRFFHPAGSPFLKRESSKSENFGNS
jgi:hypothetical protein